MRATIFGGMSDAIFAVGGIKRPNGPSGSRLDCSAKMSASSGLSYQSLMAPPSVASCPWRYAVAALLSPALRHADETQCRRSLGRSGGRPQLPRSRFQCRRNKSVVMTTLGLITDPDLHGRIGFPG